MWHSKADYPAKCVKALTASAIAMAACHAAPAFAQDGEARPATQVSEGGLSEIIVTARKRNESAQNIPVAVIAMSTEELANRNINNIEQLSLSVPQFVVARGSTGSGANLSLRGIGSNFTSIGIEQSVSVNVDGVYYGQGRVLNEAVFDMQQAEILKGPQALFFGKNSTAGALSFQTANPGNELEVMGRAGYEFRTQDKYFEGVISSPLTDTLGARLAVRVTDMDKGYVENQSTGGIFRVTDTATGGTVTDYDVPASTRWGPMEQNFNARGTLQWEPDNQFSVTLKGTVADRQSTTPGFLNELFLCPVGGTS
jgi:outer membrane receptor protein involved in Fe transport